MVVSAPRKDYTGTCTVTTHFWKHALRLFAATSNPVLLCGLDDRGEVVLLPRPPCSCRKLHRVIAHSVDSKRRALGFTYPVAVHSMQHPNGLVMSCIREKNLSKSGRHQSFTHVGSNRKAPWQPYNIRSVCRRSPGPVSYLLSATFNGCKSTKRCL